MKLTVHEDIGKSSESYAEITTVKDDILKGNSSILNLDKDHSKLFVGGLPSSFKAQKNIKEYSIEGQVEDLMLGNINVGLWNFESNSGVTKGSTER